MASPLHNLVGQLMANSIDTQLPDTWRAVTEFPVGSRESIGMRPRRERQPDFAIVTNTAAIATRPAMFCEMSLWGEVVSSSNHKKDVEDLPRAFCENAPENNHCGRISHINHYWQIHVDADHGLISALIHDFRTPETFLFGYATAQHIAGAHALTLGVPFNLSIDLADLIHRVGFRSSSQVKKVKLEAKYLELEDGGLLATASPSFEFY